MRHSVKVSWEKKPSEIFSDNKYSRVHQWSFEGGAEITASSSPVVVAVPMSLASAIDPEEAFLAALSSCHMLFFLSIAAQQNYIVAAYKDNVEGKMGRNTEGKVTIMKIILRPRVIFSGGNTASFGQIKHMHQLAHGRCFLANAVKSEIIIWL